MAGGCSRANISSGRRERIYVFHQQTARLKREIELAALGVRGGNLLVADGRLLIATPSEVIVLGINGGTEEAAAGGNNL